MGWGRLPVIDHLQGELITKEPSSLVIRVAGIGFRIEVPEGSYSSHRLGTSIEIPTTLIFRDQVPSLYGFTHSTEREFFHLLTGITGIGPKSALSILGQTSPSVLADAILREDISALVKVKGIGKKGAKRIIVELGEKIRALKPCGDYGALKISDGPEEVEAIDILVSLGCRRDEAEKALKLARDSHELGANESADVLVMYALKELGS